MWCGGKDNVTKQNNLVGLVIGTLGAFGGLVGLVLFNQYILGLLPLYVRMVAAIMVYWIVAVVPIILLVLGKEKVTEYGFSTNKLGRQITVGILIAIAMSLVLTLLPHLLGFGKNVSSSKSYQYLWHFVYEFFYCIIAVGFAEEFVFRGFVYQKIKRLYNKDWLAVLGSSVLFGLFHLFAGNIVQMIMTGFIGAFFCLCKLKIKNCSLLSLILAHGIYDALIVVWTAVFS